MSDTNGTRPVPESLKDFATNPIYAERRRERARRAALARGKAGSTAKVVTAKLRALAEVERRLAPDGDDMLSAEQLVAAGVLVRPDFATTDSRRTFREAVARALMLDAITKSVAETLLRAVDGQVREDEVTPAEAPTRMVPMRPEDFHAVGSDG